MKNKKKWSVHAKRRYAPFFRKHSGCLFVNGRMDSVFAGNAVKLYVFQQMLFHNGDCFSCRKGTDHGSDADSGDMAEEQQGDQQCGGQTAEVESCLYIFVFFADQSGKFSREKIGRDDRKHTVVGQADAKGDHREPKEKPEDPETESVREEGNPGFVYVQHFSECDSYQERDQVGAVPFSGEDHQRRDQGGLEQVIPCAEGQKRECLTEDIGHG